MSPNCSERPSACSKDGEGENWQASIESETRAGCLSWGVQEGVTVVKRSFHARVESDSGVE